MVVAPAGELVRLGLEGVDVADAVAVVRRLRGTVADHDGGLGRRGIGGPELIVDHRACGRQDHLGCAGAAACGEDDDDHSDEARRARGYSSRRRREVTTRSASWSSGG